jgi:hypothetical protein
VVGIQIANLTPGPSFDHNLCFKCPNGSWKPILDIYVLIFFQWYKKLFNPMGFDPWNHFLKIQESIGTPTPKVGVWRFNSLTLPYSQPPKNMKCDSWASLLTRTFGSLCPGCEPKARVVTLEMLRVKECAPTFLFFSCFALGPTFGFLKEFGGMSSRLYGVLISVWTHALPTHYT